MRYGSEYLRELVQRAAMTAGASADVATSLADAVISAEWAGKRAVGLAHLVDYLDGFANGRIAARAQPEITYPAPAAIRVDAKCGIAQLGFDCAFAVLVGCARKYGIGTFAQCNSFTAGELGYYTRRLAEAGLLALAVCNAPAQMTTIESRRAVFGTNPLSFAAPVENAGPFVIDQSSSATAFVKLRQAAEEGGTIPPGWAIDAAGNPTTDAREAVKGLLLAFGGSRGANIAFMVEVLAAGLTGANWSMDAPPFSEGGQSPGIGLFIVAMEPDILAPGFAARLAVQIERLRVQGVVIPGSHTNATQLDVPASLIERIECGILSPLDEPGTTRESRRSPIA